MVKKNNSSAYVASILLIIVQCFTLLGFIAKNQKDHAFEVASIILLYLFYLYAKSKYNLYVRDFIIWSLVINIVGHNFIGEYLKIYLISSIYDKALHLFGTYAFSLFIYALIIQVFPGDSPSKARECVFILTIGIALGAVFEIIEFLGDTIVKPKEVSQDNLFDTDMDLIANTLGAFAAALHAYCKNLSIFRRP